MESNYFTVERDEWLASRKGKFTASEIFRLFVKGSRPMTKEELDARPKATKKDGSEGARFVGGTTVETLFGEGAISYIREKVDDLLSGNPNGEVEQTPSLGEFKQTEWGHANELFALERFEIITGKPLIIFGGSSPKFYPYGDYCGCSPDAEVVGEDAIVEAKCPYNTDVHTRRLLYTTVQEFKEKEYKEWCQCQCQMKILGRSFAYFISYDPRKTQKFQQMKVIKLAADLEWHSEFDLRLNAAIQEMKTMLENSEKYIIVE